MKHALILILTGLTFSALAAETTPIELTASKDAFGRSNNRNGNSGASQHLVVAHNPSVRSFVGFDLSIVTNEIVGAEFSIRIQNTMPDPVSLTIAPMVQTPGNASWREGSGALGVKGRNARVGEATFQWRAFRDKPWEDAAENPIVNLMDPKLWGSPVANLTRVKWSEGAWVSVPINNVAMLEEIRESDDKIITYGLWGTAGNGTYMLCAKESGHAPKLTLRLKIPETDPARPQN